MKEFLDNFKDKVDEIIDKAKYCVDGVSANLHNIVEISREKINDFKKIK